MSIRSNIVSRALALALALGALAPLARAESSGDAPDAPAAAPSEPSPKAPHRHWEDLPEPPLRQFTAPKPERVTLPNGAVLFLMEDHELPLVDLIVLFRGGSVYEPREKAGLASICGEVMRTGGTKSKTGDQLDAELEAMASSVEVGIADWQGRASMSCLKENFDTTLAVLTDVLEHPEFRQDKIDLSKKQAKSGIARRNDDPSGIARREYARAMYGDDSPFGWTSELATVDSITRDDLIAFHKSFVGMGKGTLIGVVGDFDSKAMKAKLEAAFGKWPATPSEGAKFTKSAKADEQGEGPGSKVLFARKTDVNQTTIVMGHIAAKRQVDDPDYPALIVLNDVLGGGGFASRLLQRVRTEMGLAYGVGSRWNAPYSHKGTFSLSCQTKSESTLKAIEAMKKQLELVCAEPVNADELKVAKESIQQQLVFESDSKAEVLDRALRYEFFGFPQDYLERFQAGIAKVTAEDCLRVAKKYLHPDHLLTVVVGNDKDFDGKLDAIGAVTEIDIEKPAVAAPKAASATPAQTPETLAKAKAVVTKAVEARGGKAALEKVKSFVMKGKGTRMSQMGPLPVEVTQTIEFPDHVRMDMLVQGMSITYAYDGKAGWAKTPMGMQDIPSSQVGDLADGARKYAIPLLLSLSAADAKPGYGGQQDVDGVKCDVVLADESTTLFFDAEGNLVRRTEASPRGTTVSTWKEFRKVDGVTFPFASSTEVDGQKVVELGIASIEVNPAMPAETFAKPAGPEPKPGTPSQGGQGGGAKGGAKQGGQGN